MPVTNSCRCDYPPGGGGDCPATHLSICRSDGRYCEHECLEPPEWAMLRQEYMEAWAYGEITRFPRSTPLDTGEREQLHRGRFEDPLTGHMVTFVVPQLVGAA